jgi:hypothetical protein
MDTDRMREVQVYGNRIDSSPKEIEWFARPDSWPERSKT